VLVHNQRWNWFID